MSDLPITNNPESETLPETQVHPRKKSPVPPQKPSEIKEETQSDTQQSDTKAEPQQSDPSVSVVQDDHPTVIEPIYQSDSPSLSGKSVLSYAFGRHPEQGTLHFRLVANSGSGMFSDAWIDVDNIEAVMVNQVELTSRSFQRLYPGKSINSAGFLMAVLKDLGLIRSNTGNTRLHEHVPEVSIQQVVMARIGQSPGADSKPARRKPKGH